jgi:hypothetical protein
MLLSLNTIVGSALDGFSCTSLFIKKTGFLANCRFLRIYLFCGMFNNTM